MTIIYTLFLLTLSCCPYANDVFSRIRKTAAYHYIKKKKGRVKTLLQRGQTQLSPDTIKHYHDQHTKSLTTNLKIGESFSVGHRPIQKLLLSQRRIHRGGKVGHPPPFCKTFYT
jgi:hypothetical protein